MIKSFNYKLLISALLIFISQSTSEAIFTLSSGLNIPVGRTIVGYLKPGVNISGDLTGEIKAGTEFKLGIGGVSDYTMFFINSGSQSGAQAFYTIGPIIKPIFKLGNNSFSITEVAAGYTLKHMYGTNLGGTKHSFGFTAGSGFSISRFVFGGKYRMAVDDLYSHKWINIYIGVRL